MSDFVGTEQVVSIGPEISRGDLVRRIASLAWKHRRLAMVAMSATVAVQFLTLVGLAGQGLVIDVIRHGADPGAPNPQWPLGLQVPASWPLSKIVLAIGLLVLVAAALSGLARLATRYADEVFVQACLVDLRGQLYDKLQRLSFGFFDRSDTGQIVNRVTGDSQQVRAFIQGVLMRGGIAVVTLVVFLAYMLARHPLLTLACTSVLPLQIIVMVRYGRLTRPKFLHQARLLDVVVKHLQEAIAGVRVIRVFGREDEVTRRFDERTMAARDHRIGIGRDQAHHVPVVQSSNIFAQAVLLGFGGWLVMVGPEAGGIGLGTLWVFRGLLDRLSRQAEMLVMMISETPEALAGAERVFRLLAHRVEVDSKPGATLPAGGIRGRVELRDVTFGYDPQQPVLHDVSFIVEPGQTIAIVGPTGAGKSTVLNLLARFYDPQAGSVLIDGINVRDMPIEEFRRSVGFVFQEPFLFSHTVRSNVAYGAPESSEDTVHGALEAAQARTIIDELPDGLDTVIGERGVSLSGGQRQRLTIARALVMDPRILLLDDATGAVDALTESRIQGAMDALVKGRTTFIVAHRLSTLRRADRIIVIERGRLVDIGTHDELMDREGHYKAAALIQLSLNDDVGAPRSGGEAAS